MLGQLKGLGYGPDKVVAIAYHVDYFNDPWVDPLSKQQFSGREWAYHEAFKARDPKSPDLYYTPMAMVDGRFPMLGSDRRRLRAALDRVLAEPPRATVGLTLVDQPGDPLAKTLRVEARALATDLIGQSRLVGAAVFEDPVTTAVPRGENAGKTLVEHFAVRTFAAEPHTLAADAPATIEFALKLEPGWASGRCGVAVFLQDEATGRVDQAESIAWGRPGQASR